MSGILNFPYTDKDVKHLESPTHALRAFASRQGCSSRTVPVEIPAHARNFSFRRPRPSVQQSALTTLRRCIVRRSARAHCKTVLRPYSVRSRLLCIPPLLVKLYFASVYDTCRFRINTSAPKAKSCLAANAAYVETKVVSQPPTGIPLPESLCQLRGPPVPLYLQGVFSATQSRQTRKLLFHNLPYIICGPPSYDARGHCFAPPAWPPTQRLKALNLLCHFEPNTPKSHSHSEEDAPRQAPSTSSLPSKTRTLEWSAKAHLAQLPSGLISRHPKS